MKEKKGKEEKRRKEEKHCDTVIMSFREKLIIIINSYEGFHRLDGHLGFLPEIEPSYYSGLVIINRRSGHTDNHFSQFYITPVRFWV